jgi:hypothetical protein
MLKEFNHIARQMLFLHGHLTRPRDWAENKVEEPAKGGHRVARQAVKKARPRRFANAAAACGIVMPARLIAAQLR